MKTIKRISIRLMAIAAVAICFALPANAQINPNLYFNVDWQFNAPLKNHFSDKASGWGMNFEGGYYVAPKFGVGLFLNYHTNNEYIPRETFMISQTGTLTTDQQHTIFQLPFGANLKYRFTTSMVQPYIAVKLGANYSKMSSSFTWLRETDDNWGFYVSPEIGLNIYPFANNGLGFHIAAFYSYSTNKGSVLHYDIDKLNNAGFRLGIAF